MPGGALDVVRAGGLDGVERIFALHCDPRTDVGRVGVRVGAITAASDLVRVRLSGPGGHTARPHLTADLAYALGRVLTELPAVLDRRTDPRAGLTLVWGHVAAGGAANAVPKTGLAEGTLRCLDAATWERLPDLVTDTVASVAAPYGVAADVEYVRGVPPVVNDRSSSQLMAAAARAYLDPHAVVDAELSMGGEDFAWYLDEVPGALARLGVRDPDDEVARDLHQGSFAPDERAIALGVRLFVGTVLEVADHGRPRGAGHDWISTSRQL